MKFEITFQPNYSRGELLLRTLFGWLYIILPHAFVLIFIGIWSQILTFISFWAILFTGRYPQSFYEFQVGVHQWSLRLNARIYNLSDGYPAFGVNATDEFTQFEIAYPESLGRGTALLKVFFGAFYVGLPHGFCLLFRMFATQILVFVAWWIVLFTGEYPDSMFRFNVGTLRWMQRVNLYLGLMTDDYPPFSGKPDEELSGAAPETLDPPSSDGASGDS